MEISKRKILKSTTGVAAATLLSRILGLIRVRLEATVLGGGDLASGWLLAFAIPNLFRRLLGEGALGTALIPLVAQAEQEEGPARVRRELAVIFATLCVLLGAVVVLFGGGTWLLSEAAGRLNWEFFQTERMRLVLALLPVLMPYAFFICLSGAVGAVLNYSKVFVLPALGALLLNFFLIGGLVTWWFRFGAAGNAGLPRFLHQLALLVLAAGALQLLLLGVLLRVYGRFPDLRWGSFRDCSVLKRLWHLVLPGMIGGAALQVSFLVDRLLAVWLGSRAVPALSFVDRIIDVPIGIFALSLGTVLMAGMARTAASGNQEELARDLVFWLRHVYFICIPMAAMVIFFHEPMLRLLCLGGNYTEEDLAAARLVAVFYGAGIPAFCSLKVILPAFYARRMMKLPLYSSLAAIAANIVLNLILMWPLAQGGIALATVLASMLNNTILLVMLRRQGFDLQPAGLAGSALRAAVAAGIAAAGLHFAYFALIGGAGGLSWFQEAAAFGLLSLAFVMAYFGLAAALRAPELRELAGILRRRGGAAG